jgi:hypothetical protein
MSANYRSFSLFRTTICCLLPAIFIAGFVFLDLQPGLTTAYSENAVGCAAPSPDPQVRIGADGALIMSQNDSRFSIPDPQSWRQRFHTLKYDPELSVLEETLRLLNVFDDPQVKKLLLRAKFCSPDLSAWARARLREIIEDYRILEVRLADPFMPYATAEQISNHRQGVHILDQATNRIPFYAKEDSFPLGWLILGPQGGGKSSATFHILQQLRCPILILDPKGTWEFRAGALGCKVILPEHLQFDYYWPNEEELPRYLHTQVEGIASATGLQYGVSPLCEAFDIAFAQRKTYIERTGVNTPLCLLDIRYALDLCDIRSAKRAQYIESARSALDLLLGKNNLFSTRLGLPLDRLTSGRYILSTRFLTTVQSRYFGWFLINYLYFKSLHQPETTQLRQVIVIDDASKYISKSDTVFGSGARTSSWLHLLSTIRSSGTSILLVDQLLSPIYDDVKQLSCNWLVVGGIRGGYNISEIANAMRISPLQSDYLVKMKPRQALVFSPSTHPLAIHGQIPLIVAP